MPRCATALSQHQAAPRGGVGTPPSARAAHRWAGWRGGRAGHGHHVVAHRGRAGGAGQQLRLWPGIQRLCGQPGPRQVAIRPWLASRCRSVGAQRQAGRELVAPAHATAGRCCASLRRAWRRPTTSPAPTCASRCPLAASSTRALIALPVSERAARAASSAAAWRVAWSDRALKAATGGRVGRRRGGPARAVRAQGRGRGPRALAHAHQHPPALAVPHPGECSLEAQLERSSRRPTRRQKQCETPPPSSRPSLMLLGCRTWHSPLPRAWSPCSTAPASCTSCRCVMRLRHLCSPPSRREEWQRERKGRRDAWCACAGPAARGGLLPGAGTGAAQEEEGQEGGLAPHEVCFAPRT